MHYNFYNESVCEIVERVYLSMTRLFINLFVIPPPPPQSNTFQDWRRTCHVSWDKTHSFLRKVTMKLTRDQLVLLKICFPWPQCSLRLRLGKQWGSRENKTRSWQNSLFPLKPAISIANSLTRTFFFHFLFFSCQIPGSKQVSVLYVLAQGITSMAVSTSLPVAR